MRNLKRALSLLLAAAMLIGMMVVGASAVSYNDFPDRDEIVNKDAVSMLTTLGIIEGTDQGTYNPTGDVDRAQMAKMISVALTNNEDCDTLYQNVNSGLTDIAANWARGYINYCYTLGIIAGRGDNTFDPSANVTGVEAAKMLLTALGYDANIEGLVGNDWALNTAALAQNLGIFRNFTKDVSEPLNRDDAALLIYNALDVELIQEYRNGYAISYDDHRTILSSVFGVIRVEGVVVANEWARLEETDSDEALREGRTTLDNVVWYDSTTANTRVEEGIVVDGIVPFNVSTPVEYIGKAVTLYVEKTTILSNSTVIGVATNDDQNVVLTNVSNEDTSSDYLKGTGVTADNDTEYYVNYGAVESENAAIDLINEHTTYARDGKFDLNGIEVEVIDNDDDGTADYVLYLVETLSEVSRYSERNEELSFYTPYDSDGDLVTSKNSNSPVTATRDLADVVYAESVSLGGVVTTDALDLATDDLILYVEYGGRTYVYLPEIVTGTMTRVDRDRNDELYITVDDADEYRQSYILEAASLVDVDVTRFDITEARQEPGFDTAYDFILDSNGYVIAIRPAEEQVTNYALVIESAWSQNALTRSGEVTVLMADGTKGTYPIDWNDSRKVFDYDGEQTNNYLDGMLENYLGTRDVLGGYRTGAAIGTVIAYSLNADGDELTIENIMNQNTLVTTGTDRGYTADATNADGENVPQVDVDTTDIVYIDDNFNALAEKNTQYKVGTVNNSGAYTEDEYENGDGTLYLTVDNGNAADGAEISYAIDRDTVAFYFIDSNNNRVADDGEYGVATGWENMSDVAAGTDAQVYPVLEKDGRGGMEATRLADLVLFNSAPTSDSDQWMLVLDANYIRSDELWLNVVFEDGTAAEIEIDSTGGHDFDEETSYMKAYAYTENPDGTYDVSTREPVGAYDGSLIRNDTVDWGGVSGYLTIVGSTQIWDVTDVTRADEDVSGGSFNYTDKNAVVIRGGSREENIRTAWVWEKDEDSDPGYVAGVYNPRVQSVVGNTITIRKYAHDILGTKELTEVLRDGLDDVDVEKVTMLNGVLGDIMITDSDGAVSFWNINYNNLRRVTYNNADHFVGQNESFDIDNDVVLVVNRDSAGNITGYRVSTNVTGTPTDPTWTQTTAVVGAETGSTPTADVELVDGWSVTGVNNGLNAVRNQADMVTYNGTLYYAAGETVELRAGNNRTITVTYNGETVTFNMGATPETKEFTMPAYDIVVGVDDTPAEIAVDYQKNITDTFEYGNYMLNGNPATALSNDTSFEVTVVVSQVPDQDSMTLTLSNSDGSLTASQTIGKSSVELGDEITFTFNLTGVTTDQVLTLPAAD